MRIVVTGYRGFIGRHLVALLEGGGHQVIGLSRSEGADITHTATFDALGPFDLLIHLAAQSFVPLSYRQPALFYHDNIVGTLNCLEACRTAGARMIFVSSYVYGQPQSLPITEAHPVQPSNPYASSKYMGEQLCQAYHRDYGVPVSILRPFNVYGEGQSGSFLIPAIINQLPSGTILLRDPRPERDFVHVEDLARAILLLATYAKPYSLHHAGSGVSTSIGDILEILRSANFITEDRIAFSGEQREGEVLETRADITRIRQDIGWQPQKDFKEELLRLAAAVMKPVNQS